MAEQLENNCSFLRVFGGIAFCHRLADINRCHKSRAINNDEMSGVAMKNDFYYTGTRSLAQWVDHDL